MKTALLVWLTMWTTAALMSAGTVVLGHQIAAGSVFGFLLFMFSTAALAFLAGEDSFRGGRHDQPDV